METKLTVKFSDPFAGKPDTKESRNDHHVAHVASLTGHVSIGQKLLDDFGARGDALTADEEVAAVEEVGLHGINAPVSSEVRETLATINPGVIGLDRSFNSAGLGVEGNTTASEPEADPYINITSAPGLDLKR